MSNNISDSFDQLTQEALSVSELERCYATLGLNNSASIEQVKERCKELIKQWHPDQFKDDPARHQVAVEKFAAFKKAYDTISSTENSPNAAAASSASSEQPRTKQPAEEPKQLSVNSVNESVYAEFWRRVVARLLDFLIIVLPSSLIIVLGNKSAGAEALATLVFMAYCVVMESSEKQATLGKMAVGIKVVDVQGNRLSIGRAVGRHLGNLLNALTFGIGYAVAAFSKRGQALHDMVSGCYVVNKAATPSEVVSCAIKPRLSAASILLLIFIAIPVPLGILAAIAIPQFSAYKRKAEFAVTDRPTTEGIPRMLKQQAPVNNGKAIEKDGFIFYDDVVVDTRTGLMWTRNIFIQEKQVSWNQNMFDLVYLKTGGYNDWRLPRFDELETMLKYGSKSPLEHFSTLNFNLPKTSPYTYWTSNDGTADTAKCVDMSNILESGNTINCSGGSGVHYTWPVRNTK